MENQEEIRTFLIQNSFGILVNQTEGKLCATHIPLELDTNKDGIVSQEEKNAALGISSTQSTTSSSTSNEDMKDTLKLLLDTIKLNAQNSSENTDLSSFKNIMKMMNNQNNSSDLTYVKEDINRYFCSDYIIYCIQET